LLEESLALAREADDATAVALAMVWLADAAAGQGDLDRAQALATEALARWSALADSGWWRTSEALSVLGYIAALRGDQDEAETRFTEMLDLARAVGADLATARALEHLGTCARERGDPRRAAALYAESLALAGDARYLPYVYNNVKSLGAVAAVTGRPHQAARLFGAALALRERHGLHQPPAEQPRLERAIAPARAALPEAVFAAAWSDGRALSMEQAIAEALTLADEVRASQAADPDAHREPPLPPNGCGPSRRRDRRDALPQTPA
jgi:tetratricopeptide (TPR) repeat protein